METIEKFLEQLFRNNETIEIRCISPQKKVTSYFLSVADNKRLSEIVERHRENDNIYYSVNPRIGESSKKSSRITSIFIDIDAKDFVSYEAFTDHVLFTITQFPLKPSFIISSGNGYHVYWKLKESPPIEEDDTQKQVSAEWERIAKSLNNLFKADKHVHDISRILRLPGTINQKNKAIVGILEANDNSYLLEDFTPLFPYIPQITQSQHNQQCSLSDDEIINIISKSKQATKFDALMSGDLSEYGNDHSRADAALCSLLAFYTKDKAQLERLFSLSALAQRKKWTQRRDYRERTLDNALSHVTKCYEVRAREDKPESREGTKEYTREDSREDCREDSSFFCDTLKTALSEDATIKLISGKTGIGKTYAIAETAINLARQGENVTIFCASIPEIENTNGKIKSMGFNDVALVMSGKEDEKEDEIEEKKDNKKAAIYITTYAYLGEKGESGKIYKQAKELLKDRIVFCDEIQSLWQKMQVLYPLAGNYKKNIGTESNYYTIASKCPKRAKKGTCQDCFIAWKKVEEKKPVTSYVLNHRIEEKELASYQTKDQLPLSLQSRDIEDATTYCHFAGNVFTKYIEHSFSIEKAIEKLDQMSGNEKDLNYTSHIKLLSVFMPNLHIRSEFPTQRDTEKNILAVSREELKRKIELGEKVEDVKLPFGACSVPFMAGLNVLPLLQVLSMAKTVTMFSATTPYGLMQAAEEISKAIEKPFSFKTVKETPYKFNITMLKLSERLSTDKVTDIINILNTEDKEAAFCVCATESDAKRTYNTLNRKSRHIKSILFSERDYREEIRSKSSDYNPDKINIVTYARSSITKSIDFPNYSMLLIDCVQFLPYLAIGSGDKEDVKSTMLQDISQNITQIIGRVLRSSLKRIPGETVIDERNISVLLHGIPVDLINFKIDSDLVAQYKEHIDDQFCSVIAKRQIPTIASAIKSSLSGQEILSPKEDDKKHILEKAKNGIENLSHQERTLLTDTEKQELVKQREAQKEYEKNNSIETRLKDCKAAKTTWTNAYRLLNIGHMSKLNQNRLKVLWKTIDFEKILQ